jgi:DNA gyrase/topoisomerase IV subunit B
VTQENKGTPNEGRRAVYRAVKTYLAANGLTKEAVDEMIRRAVVEQLRQVVGKTLSDPAYVARVLSQRGTYDLTQAMRQGAKDAVAAAIEVKIKGLS